MKLQTLRLHGFKSFSDRTTLDFREGVTAIVGSNGCGKSNIADSIRWVLGEQRASAVRGSKMDEVIFQGTARRRPLNFAEVSLLFDNESGRIPVPQSQLEISRKVFREGGSEYSINRASCRLRDVQSLLRDTGLGANAYSVIEATMIDTLLSDRAEERRALFEEAAGIGKYKDSRQAAARRLEAADADLRRLDDVIAEVDTKVRSLGRQRRKAERHRELQRLRLDLEVAIAQEEVAAIEVSLRSAMSNRERLEVDERSAAAERATAEALLEQRKTEAADLGRQRVQVAGRLDTVRLRIDERERLILVGGERRTHGEQRRAQLADERLRIEQRLGFIREEIVRAGADVVQRSEAVQAARRELELRGAENEAIRAAVVAERSATNAAADRARSLAREIAKGEGERAAAEKQHEDASDRYRQLIADMERLRLDLAQLTDQTELWETQADDIRADIARAASLNRLAEEERKTVRAREQRAREEVRAVEDSVSTLSAQISAAESVELSYEGYAPAVAALMAMRGAFPGVHGPLADALPIGESDERVRRLEAYLGPLLNGIVVDDFATARAIRRWFHDEWSEGGSLLVLPLEVLNRSDGMSRAGSESWVEVLLEAVVHVDNDPLSGFEPGPARVGPRGDVVDSRGIIRLTGSGNDQGILTRRSLLARQRKDLEKARVDRDARYRERDDLVALLEAAEEAVRTTLEEKRIAEARLRSLELDAAEHRDRRMRLQQERERTEKRLDDLVASRAEMDARLETLKTALADLSVELTDAGVLEAAARDRLATLEGRWDLAREAEAELRVVVANSESEAREANRRLFEAERDLKAAEGRLSTIESELTDIERDLGALSSQAERAASEVQALFTERDEAAGSLTLVDSRLSEVDSDLVEAGERARASRRREALAVEERHGLELEIAESRSRLERIRERLEVEWGRPWSGLLSDAGEPGAGTVDEWRARLRDASDQLGNLGPVNMLAVEEHAEESTRLDFLMAQRTDLVDARDNLMAAIREINKTACEVFEATFESVRTNFIRTFHSLFHGGDCDIWLTDPTDPLESPVEIQASPLGKKTQRIHLLSGGERTLTALALLFALYLVKPSPFCVLDEVDAPLDETNVGRFIQLLQDFKHETQFIVITHHPRTMEAADWVYGVTMEEPGVSTIVGVELIMGNPLSEKARTESVAT